MKGFNIMLCPNCKDTQLVMSERKGVEIDYCPQCRGVWLDRGELDKIIEKSNQEDQSYQQQHHEDHKKYSSNKPYKKKNFWMELFD